MAPATNGVAVNGHKANGSASWQEKHQLAAHFIGGNKLSAAPPSAVKDFVTQADGHSVITSVSTGQQETCAEHWLTGHSLGSHCEQRYCSRQRNQIRAKMGIRDFRRRASHPVHCDGYARRLSCQRRLHQNGRSVCRGMSRDGHTARRKRFRC